MSDDDKDPTKMQIGPVVLERADGDILLSLLISELQARMSPHTALVLSAALGEFAKQLQQAEREEQLSDMKQSLRRFYDGFGSEPVPPPNCPKSGNGS